MEIHYIFHGGDLPLFKNYDAAAVIDVLRASSSITAALHTGAEKIIPVIDYNLAYKHKNKNVLLGGERGGKKIKGFDLGNSPLEYLKPKIKNKTIYFSSTNGTKAVKKAAALSKNVFIACFLNLTAAAKALSLFKKIIILGSGREGGASFEDTHCAGALINKLKPSKLNDGALMAKQIYEKNTNILNALKKSYHGKYLLSLSPLYKKDILFCAQKDKFKTVGIYSKNAIRIKSC